ncbi:MAG TPA: hypothetical protein VLY23_02005 [Candidatus Acidoferrum sp.]|nr:hypothetical protein [Candidatus Acidoferrum sp.]
MDVRKLEAQLRSEGFTHTYVWQDASEAFYPNHTHAAKPRTSFLTAR